MKINGLGNIDISTGLGKYLLYVRKISESGIIEVNCSKVGDCDVGYLKIEYDAILGSSVVRLVHIQKENLLQHKATHSNIQVGTNGYITTSYTSGVQSIEILYTGGARIMGNYVSGSNYIKLDIIHIGNDVGTITFSENTTAPHRVFTDSDYGYQEVPTYIASVEYMEGVRSIAQTANTTVIPESAQLPKDANYNGKKMVFPSINYIYQQANGDFWNGVHYSYSGYDSLIDLDIPDNSYKLSGLEKCTNINSIKIPFSVTHIHPFFLRGTTINQLIIPSPAEWTPVFNFSHSEMFNITESINYYTFGSSVVRISCDSLVVNDVLYRVTQTGNSAWGFPPLLPPIRHIAKSAFEDITRLESVTIPDSVTSIGYSAFEGCTSLTSVIVGNSITSIGARAFFGCQAMQYYDFSTQSTIPTLANIYAFSSIPSTCKIIVPDALYDEWIAATNWSTYADNIIKKSDWDASQVTE